MEAVAVSIAIVIGLTEVVKRLGLPKKFIPAFAVLLGAGISMATGGVTTTAILGGIIVGLTSQGLYSGTKATIGK